MTVPPSVAAAVRTAHVRAQARVALADREITRLRRTRPGAIGQQVDIRNNELARMVELEAFMAAHGVAVPHPSFLERRAA